MLNRFLISFRSFGFIFTINIYYRHLKSIIMKLMGYKYIKRKILDFSMILDLYDKGLSGDLRVKGVREKQLYSILKEIINPGDHVIDLGANIGYYPLIAMTLVGSTGKVYALEPSPQNFKLLNKNIVLNSAENVIESFQIGGGSKPQKVKFYLSERSNQHTMLNEIYRFGGHQDYLLNESLEVDVVDMSSFIMDKPPIDLIRMDIEGYEVSVLQGLKSAIESGVFKGKIVFETHWPKYSDKHNSIRKQLKMLFNNGYYPSIITSNNEEPSRLIERGYLAKRIIQTSATRKQGIYYNIKPVDAEYFICDAGGVRDVVFEKR